MQQCGQNEISGQRGRKHSLLGALLKYGIPAIVSVGLCWLLFSEVDFGEMMGIIRENCHFEWIAAALVLSVCSHVLRAMRWRIQLRALGMEVPLFVVVLSIFGTYAVNLVLPRLGELWRTGYIAKRQNVAFDRVFGSMIADRLADTVTVGLLTLATLLFGGAAMMEYLLQNEAQYERIAGVLTSPWLWGCAVASVGALCAVVYALRRTTFVVKLREFCSGLWKGFAVIATMPGKGLWLLLTVGLWGCYFFQFYLCMFAFAETKEVIEVHGMMAAFVIWVLSSISMGVPSNGGIGPWQWAVIFGLGIYAVPSLSAAVSAAFANLVMGTNTLLLIVLGLFTFVCIALDRKQSRMNKK